MASGHRSFTGKMPVPRSLWHGHPGHESRGMAILAMKGRGHRCPPQVFAMAVPAIAPSRARCPCHAPCGMAILAMGVLA